MLRKKGDDRFIEQQIPMIAMSEKKHLRQSSKNLDGSCYAGLHLSAQAASGGSSSYCLSYPR